MLTEIIITLIIFAYLHKKVRFYFVLRKAKKSKKLMMGAKPYLIRRGKTGVLLIHGFTATPQELKSLADYLVKKNITVYTPLLKGHGTVVEDLARTRQKDWEESALTALNKLSKITSKTYIAGSSMGGNLAFRIATKGKVAGIISMGAPMFFKRDRSAKLFLFIIGFFKNFIKKGKGMDMDKWEFLKTKVHYTMLPLNCLRDVIRLMNQSEKDLVKIKVPVLIMQSKTDHLLSKENAKLIYKKLSSKKKRIFFVPDSYHVFCQDKNRNIAFKEIYKFIKET